MFRTHPDQTGLKSALRTVDFPLNRTRSTALLMQGPFIRRAFFGRNLRFSIRCEVPGVH